MTELDGLASHLAAADRSRGLRRDDIVVSWSTEFPQRRELRLPSWPPPAFYGLSAPLERLRPSSPERWAY